MRLLPLLFVACSTPSSSPVCAPPEDELPTCDAAAYCGFDGDCVRPLVWGSTCFQVHLDDLDPSGLLFEGHLHQPPADGNGLVATYADADAWAAFLASWRDRAPDDVPAGLDAVDFTTSMVVVVNYADSTCDQSLARHGVSPGGALYVEWLERNACAGCDMEDWFVVMYALPRAAPWPQVCAQVRERC